jgi:hypothetical protein
MKNTGAGVAKTKLNYSDPMLLLEVEGLARDGFDDGQIAEILDVGPETFSRNKKKKKVDGSGSLLEEALSKGRRPLSVLVENSLYKRAIGQIVKTTSITRKWVLLPGVNNDQPVEVVHETITETELPGDVNAQALWLKHHKPDIYNVRPKTIDLTTCGKELNSEIPKIGLIQHISMQH